MNIDDRTGVVGEKKYSSVWESTPHWTYRRSDLYPNGTGLGKNFDLRSVRDTFYGRLCGFVNRVKRHLP